MLFKKRKSNQESPSSSISSAKTKKSKSARNFFLKLSNTPKSNNKPIITSSTPITKRDTIEDALLTNILHPPAIFQYSPSHEDEPAKSSSSSSPNHLVLPRILEFEIDTIETSTPRGSKKSNYNQDTTDSIFDINENSITPDNYNEYEYDDKSTNNIQYKDELEEAEDEAEEEEDDDDEFFFFDDFKGVDSYSITETNIQIFKKYNHEGKFPDESKIFNDSYTNPIDNLLIDYEQEEKDNVEDEDDHDEEDQAGLESDSSFEIDNLEMLLIHEKQTYLIKQQEREIKYLQSLLNYQNNLINQFNHHKQTNQKLLPPFHVNSHREKNQDDDKLSLISSNYNDDEDSFIMSGHLISSRSTSIDQVNI